MYAAGMRVRKWEYGEPVQSRKNSLYNKNPDYIEIKTTAKTDKKPPYDVLKRFFPLKLICKGWPNISILFSSSILIT